MLVTALRRFGERAKFVYVVTDILLHRLYKQLIDRQAQTRGKKKGASGWIEVAKNRKQNGQMGIDRAGDDNQHNLTVFQQLFNIADNKIVEKNF